MAVEINDLTLDVSPASADEFEIQETGGGLTKKGTLGTIPAGAAAGFYIRSSFVAVDATYVITDFVGSGEVTAAIMVVATNTSEVNPSCVVEIQNAGLTPIFAEGASWQVYTSPQTGTTGVSGKNNLWIDTTTTPNQVKYRNRTSFNRDARFFIFSHSNSGA